MKVRWLCWLIAALLIHTGASAQMPGPGAAPSAPAQTPAAPSVSAPESQPAAAAAPAAPTAAVPAAPAKPPAETVDAAGAEPENYDPNAPGDWEYKDADLQTVLSSLALRANLNLIVGDNVTGRVTVLLRGITARQALEVIAESKGLVVRDENKIVKVLTREAADMLPTFTKVYTLGYAKAAEVAVILQPNLTKQGRITVDPRSNSLVVTDTQPSLERVANLLPSLDTQTPQVLIEAKFIDADLRANKQMGANWSGTLVNKTFSLGFDPAFFSKPLSGGEWTLPNMVFTPPSASATLSFFLNDTDSELIASPSVVTMDNVKARIAIAEQVPIPQIEFNETTGSYQSKGFEWKDIGTILTVTPRINKDGFITMEVVPEVSGSEKNVSIAGIDVPIVDTRTASTVVLVKSGNTLVIGGLVRETTSDAYTKVPILGDVPGLGALFRSKSLQKTKRNLLVFLTPSLISPEMKYDAQSSVSPAYTNDKFMPRDNAKPVPFKETWSRIKPSASVNAPAQNFGPK